MTDFLTEYNTEFLRADLTLTNGDLATDNGLKTAVIISLFTDARADEDELPAGETDKRGYWGELLSKSPGDKWGSKLWTLSREKVTAVTLRRAEQYAHDALQWLKDDRVAEGIYVRAFEVLPRVPGRGSVLGLIVEIRRPAVPAITYQFDHLWRESA